MFGSLNLPEILPWVRTQNFNLFNISFLSLCNVLVVNPIPTPFRFRVSIKESSISKLGSVCRRIYRIFSHAFYHHRRIYDKFEVDFVSVISYMLTTVRLLKYHDDGKIVCAILFSINEDFEIRNKGVLSICNYSRSRYGLETRLTSKRR